MHRAKSKSRGCLAFLPAGTAMPEEESLQCLPSQGHCLWKRKHSLMLWWGRETSKHMWCPGTWHDRHIAGGLATIRSTLLHYQVLLCCSDINRPKGIGSNLKKSPCQVLDVLIVNLRPSPGPCSHPCQSAEGCLSPGDMVLVSTAANIPPLLGILSSSKRTNPFCLSWASSPSPIHQ